MGTKQLFRVDNDRLEKLKKQVINLKQTIDFERIEFQKVVYEQYRDYSPAILRARFFEYLLDHKTIYIDDNLLVGSLAKEVGAFYIYPEWNPDWLVEDDKFDIPEDKKELVKETYDYWRDRSLYHRIADISKKKWGYNEFDYVDAGAFQEAGIAPSGVSNSNYERAITKGLQAIIDEAQERYDALDIKEENRDKFDFYEAVIIETKAIIRYAERYSALAKELAEKETDNERKAELLEIADVTSRVPKNPATNFREALQSHYFAHLASEIEQVGCGVSQGYLGQVLEPFYQQDIAKGDITKEQAVYLLENFFIKLNDINYYYGQSMDIGNSGDTAQTINVGGLTADGRDATGEVDYLILEAQKHLQLPQPPLALIYHDKLKPEFVSKAYEVVRTGVGMPQFMNANVLIERSLDAYSRYGATIEDARRSAVYGCVSTAIPNKTAYLMQPGYNLAKGVELVINNGVDPLTGLDIGAHTGDFTEFKSFDEIVDAYIKQNDKLIRINRNIADVYHLLISQQFPLPFRSALTDGCLESGKDLWNDGAEFVATAFVVNCGVDAANSLAAIKKVVFDDKTATLEQLRDALRADFEGYEILQKQLQKAPKHGNNDEYVEAIVRKIYKSTYEILQETKGNYFGKYIKPDAYSKSAHNYFGLLTGALPNGRKSRQTLTDGSVSATPGTDVNGPTVLVSSAATGIDTIAYNSAHLNVKINPAQFKDAEGNAALSALIKGYFDQGGNHIQFNCVDASVLRDARIHPENHADLVVRVAGFSAFFTRLHPGVQDEIIARTEHDLAV